MRKFIASDFHLVLNLIAAIIIAQSVDPLCPFRIPLDCSRIKGDGHEIKIAMFDQSNDFISYRCKFAEGQFQASESTKTEQEGFKAIITSLREISRRTPKLVLGPGAYNGVCIGTQWFFNGNDLTLSADTAPRFKHVMRIDADTTSGNSWQLKNLVVKWRGKTLDGNIVFNAAIKKIIVPVSFRSQCLKCHKDGGTTTIEFIYKETTTEYGQDVQVEKQFPITVKSEDLACMEGSVWVFGMPALHLIKYTLTRIGSKEHTIAIGLPKSEDLQPAATQKSGMLTRARPVDDGVYENPDLRAEQENNFDGGNQFFAGGSSSQATYAPHDFAGQGALQNEPSSSDLLLPREGLQPQWDTTSIQHQEGGSYDYNYLYPTSLQQQSNVPQWDLPHYGPSISMFPTSQPGYAPSSSANWQNQEGSSSYHQPLLSTYYHESQWNPDLDVGQLESNMHDLSLSNTGDQQNQGGGTPWYSNILNDPHAYARLQSSQGHVDGTDAEDSQYGSEEPDSATYMLQSTDESKSKSKSKKNKHKVLRFFGRKHRL